MATTTELQSDHEEICKAAAERRPADPEVVKRVRTRAAAAREVLRKRGATDAAVSLIREVRDE